MKGRIKYHVNTVLEVIKGFAPYLLPPIIILMLLISFGKFFNQGATTARGILISHTKGIKDCVEISKTSQGESAISSYCSFTEIKNIPKLRSEVEVIYTVSPALFMDTVSVAVIDDLRDKRD